VEGRHLALPAAADIAASPQYQELLADCREISERTERNLVEGFWHLGERIAQDLPESREETYGKQIMLALERDLAIDRTTLVRAVQVYRTWALPEIGDTCVTNLTWRKIRMLVALDEPLRKQIEDRIRSGELRTDDDVHKAIQALKFDLGMLPANASGTPRYQLELDLDIDTNKPLRVLWGKADPAEQTHLVANLIAKINPAGIGRRDALQAMKLLERSVAILRRRLDAGGDSND